MQVRLKSITMAAALLLLWAGVPGAVDPPTAGRSVDLTWGEVGGFLRTRDAFMLRDRLERAKSGQAPPTRAGRAIAAHAFNDPAGSNALLEYLPDHEVPDTLRASLAMLMVANHLQSGEYAKGLVVARRLVTDSASLERAMSKDAHNYTRIFGALHDVPPQTATRRGASRLALAKGRMPVTIGDSSRHYVFDTGANLSTIMRSEARAVGLRLVPAGIEVGSSTDRRVTADLGIASRVTIGAMEFENVVFLVMDDSLLTFGDIRLPGIIGFPVISQMGEVHLRPSGELFVPARGQRRTRRNLALSGLKLLTPVNWEGERLLGRLDTGADRTQVYWRAYRRMSDRIDARSVAKSRLVGGAGGLRTIPVRVIEGMRIGVGGTTATIDSVDVVLQSFIADPRAEFLDANLGHDLFDQFDELIVDFDDMAVELRGPRHAAGRR